MLAAVTGSGMVAAALLPQQVNLQKPLSKVVLERVDVLKVLQEEPRIEQVELEVLIVFRTQLVLELNQILILVDMEVLLVLELDLPELGYLMVQEQVILLEVCLCYLQQVIMVVLLRIIHV